MQREAPPGRGESDPGGARWNDRSSGAVGWTCIGTRWPRACGCRARGARGSNTCARSARRPRSCCGCATGWRRTGSPTWRWRARGCTGSPCSTCSRTPSRACWSTPPTSNRSRGGRRTSWIASGSRNCWSTGCCGAASCPRSQIRELRDLTRHRKVLIQERQRAANRLAQAVAGRGHQAGVGRHRHPRGVGPGDAGGAGAGHHRPRGPGRPGAGQAAQEAGGLAAGRWPGGSARTTRFWSVSCSPTWTIWMRRSPP